MLHNYRLVIFDWDGTLYRSIDLIEKSIVAAGDAMGTPIPPATARSIIGLGLKAAQGILFPDTQPDEGFLRKFHLAYRRHYEAGEPAIELYEGAYELVRDLHASGIVVAVATAKSRAGIDRSLAATGLARFVAHSRTPEECRPKPDPQMIDEIMRETGKQKAETLMVGDTTHDLKMGLNAGVAILGISHGAHAATELAALEPLDVCRDITMLRRALLG